MRIGILPYFPALLLVLVSTTLSAQTSEPVVGAVDSTRSYPAFDEFVAVDEEPKFDTEELYRNLKYPEIARKDGIEGNVHIGALIDEEGRVVKYLIVHSDNRVLDEAATRAVLATSFAPAKQGGNPVATWITIPIRFRIH
jgi:protein TonB